MTREQALTLLKEYNAEPFHLKHALTVEGVMKYFADLLGYGSERDFWGLVGLLHDLDFEKYPDEHCIKEQEILREAGAPEELIHAVASHGYGVTVDVKPEHPMEKVLFATDELTGLIGAVARMHPSGSVKDLETKSVLKKFKTPKFADMSKFIALIIDSMNHDISIGKVMDPTEKIHRLLEKHRNSL